MLAAGEGLFKVGQIWLLLNIAGAAIALLSIWDVQGHNVDHATSLCKMDGNPQLAELQTMLALVIWKNTEPGVAMIIAPHEFKGLTPSYPAMGVS